MEKKIHKYLIKNTPFGELSDVIKGLWLFPLLNDKDLQIISAIDLEDEKI